MTDRPRPPSPEEFKVRVQLDLLTRLVAMSVTLQWSEAGLTSEQCAEALEKRLQADQARIDEMVGGYAQNPAITALYTEEAADVFENVRKEFGKVIGVLKSRGK